MKKFKYRVESFLRFLKFSRESALREVKEAETYHRNLTEKYSFMEQQMREAYDVNSGIGKSAVDIRYVHDNNQFIQMLKIHMKNLSIEIVEAEKEYQAKYQALLDIQMRVEKMEIHKESEYEAYKKDYRKKQQKLTDEINNTRRRGKNAKSL